MLLYYASCTSHVIKGSQRPTVYRLLKTNGGKERKKEEGTRAIPSFSTPKGDATCTREASSAKTRNSNNNRTLTTRQSAIGNWDRRTDRRKTVRRREEGYPTALRSVRVHAHTQIKRTFHFIPISAVAHLELFSTFFFLYR